MGTTTQLRDTWLYVAVFLNDYPFDNPLHIKMQVYGYYNKVWFPSSFFDQ